MNSLANKILKGLRKIYPSKTLLRPECEHNPDLVSKFLLEVLTKEEPCMIARFGATELSVLMNYFGVLKGKQIFEFIKGKSFEWWWNENTIRPLEHISGFFPLHDKYLRYFGELFLNDIKELDILGSWLLNENYLEQELKGIKRVSRGMMDPFWTNMPWTKVLEGKKVLVIHPFDRTINSQYKKRDKLFNNPMVLPKFELITYKPVVSHGANSTQFGNWFEALEFMKTEIDKIDYDIALIGAGAYGFHLAAHIKRQGKKSVHIGGSLQLFFGIWGKRWDNEVVSKRVNYQALVNEYWVRPADDEKPKDANKVEGAAYW
ncbi:MAG: hypothetical protein PF517_13880 [Salinivirgaceae bacterium]|jgi:hypothetical protein|nr:hypothetical protein [Salinivirgaceae bacterium]